MAAEHQTLHSLAATARPRLSGQPDWWYGQYYAIENERGQDDTEDLFNPGRFCAGGRRPVEHERLGILEAVHDPIAGTRTRRRELARRSRRTLAATAKPADNPGVQSVTRRRLGRAANDFIITRKKPDGRPARASSRDIPGLPTGAATP